MPTVPPPQRWSRSRSAERRLPPAPAAATPDNRGEGQPQSGCKRSAKSAERSSCSPAHDPDASTAKRGRSAVRASSPSKRQRRSGDRCLSEGSSSGLCSPPRANSPGETAQRIEPLGTTARTTQQKEEERRQRRRRFCGKVCSMHPQGKGCYLHSPEFQTIYRTDKEAFLPRKWMKNFAVGQKVSFTVTTHWSGNYYAKEVRHAHGDCRIRRPWKKRRMSSEPPGERRQALPTGMPPHQPHVQWKTLRQVERVLRHEHGLLPAGQSLCLKYLQTQCCDSEGCQRYHTPEAQVGQIKAALQMVLCDKNYGRPCFSASCLFGHEDEEMVPTAGDGWQHSWKGATCSDPQAMQQHCTPAETTAATEPPAPPSVPEDQPTVLHIVSPELVVIYKPAGWKVAHAVEAAEADPEAARPDADLISGDTVQCLGSHPATACYSEWYALHGLQPGEACSGWVVLARSCGTRQCLENLARTCKIHAYSLALVSGEFPHERGTTSWARREDGELEVKSLAHFSTRQSEGTGRGSGRCTLLMLKASGSACGCERVLLRLLFHKAIVGEADAESQGDGFEVLCPRPFYHTYALAVAAEQHVSPSGLSIICPLAQDLRKVLSLFEATEKDAEALRLRLATTGSIPADVSKANEKGHLDNAVFDPKNKVPRKEWVLQFMDQALQDAEAYALPRRRGPDGDEVRLTDLRWRFPNLAEALHDCERGALRIVARDPQKTLLVDDTGTWVRRRPALDKLQAFVEDYVSQLQPGVALEREVLVNNFQVRLLLDEANIPPTDLLRKLRSSSFFAISDDAEAIILRPLQERIRLGIERLVTDMDKDTIHKVVQAGKKLGVPGKKSFAEGRVGLPLAWLLGTYPMYLAASKQPPSLLAAVEALKESTIVDVDLHDFSVRLKAAPLRLPFIDTVSTSPLRVPALEDACESGQRLRWQAAAAEWETANPQGQQTRKRVRGGGSGEVKIREASDQVRIRRSYSEKHVRLMRKLLDYYFEPFNLQIQRQLLHAVEADQGPHSGSCGGQQWSWSLKFIEKEFLRFRHFLALTPEVRAAFLEEVAGHGEYQYVRFVSRRSDRELLVVLTYEPDFRLPVLRSPSPKWLQDHFLEFRQEVAPLKTGAAAILTYACGRSTGWEDWQLAGMKERNRWFSRVHRQLTAYNADILCAQQVEAVIEDFVCCETVAASTRKSHHSLRAIRYGRADSRFSCQGPAECGTLLDKLADKLDLEDYEWCAMPVRTVTEEASANASEYAGCSQRANLICWKRDRWSLVSCGAVVGGGLHVTLAAKQAPAWKIGIGCLESAGSGYDLEAPLEELRGRPDLFGGPTVICGTFGTAAPSEVGAMIKKFLPGGWQSSQTLMHGEEPAWTWTGSSSNDWQPRCADGIWLGNASALTMMAALAGPQKGVPRIADDSSRPRRDILPTDHLPLLAVVQHAAPGGDKDSVSQ
eukprot:TRINITY_DN16112_c0_g1_i3.p1 TRINITY_DN16112_c0_g1~~TRINITY_DN16112_c0_g1_i3.p1  ORF type:complete len:1441 (+),score=259.58 TRINITY_DN16112_c0_g1_i3:79-4401(+)